MAKFIFQAGVFFKRPLYPANTSTVVTVYDAETGSIAPVWNDRAGADPRANPGAIWQEGQIRLYLNAGRYNIVASNGPDSKTWNDVIIVDPDAGGGGTGNVPSGGTTGQVLAKASSTNYDTEWVNQSGVGSDRRTVTAVTSSSGIVTINYALGDYFTLELSENVGGWIISNPPSAGVGATIGKITQDSTARTVAFGAQYNFTASSPLDAVPTTGQAMLIMTSFDGGDTWWLTMDTLA